MNPKPSSLDFYAFVKNYRSRIEGCFIKKVYQTAQTDFLFQIYSSSAGKNYLVVSLKKGLFFYEAERPEEATPLSMLLRKSLSERRIVSIEQINFDRVVKITLHTGQEIILELFREGNFIITNEGKIEFATDLREWRNRKILKGEPYIPPSTTNPLEFTDEEFSATLSRSKASIVQTLATRFNLGGDMAEELLFRLGIDKDVAAGDTLQRVGDLRKGINDILLECEQGRAYYYSAQNLLSPVIMNHAAKTPASTFPDLNDGILDYINNHYPVEEEKDQLARRIESMEKTMEEFEKQKLLTFQRGNYLMQNLQSFDAAIRKLNRIRTNQDLGSLKEFDGYSVLSYNAATRELTLSKDDLELTIDLNLTAGQNANEYFKNSKDFKAKIEGAIKAIEEVRARRLVPEKEKRKKRSREWYETYHWFFSSEGILVISGRDAKSNERIVKRHLKDTDLYVHADVYGAPSTIIKVEKDRAPTEITIREACAFAVSFSRAWPAGASTGSAYWVYPSQVSKTPESGEFVTTGSWIVRGKRNYLFDLPLKLAIMLRDTKQGKIPMVFPVTDTEKISSDAVIVVPGQEKRTAVALEISKKIGVGRDEIEAILPPGNSDIL